MKMTNPNLWTISVFLIGTGLRLGGYQSKPVFHLCFVGATLLFLYSAVVVTASVPRGLIPKWHAFCALRFGRTVSLRDAARDAYEVACKNSTLWAHAAEILGIDRSPDGVLDYVATTLACTFPSSEDVRQAPARNESMPGRQGEAVSPAAHSGLR
ncbi:MAG: hypothetical protein EOP20_15100 [Hyphomicrobiales bacterium]|nr:MAG: hypothetical protein EOP20_15100 [Hyphomicrobiales bacterium]